MLQGGSRTAPTVADVDHRISFDRRTGEEDAAVPDKVAWCQDDLVAK
jgi:hypothetical protein